MRNSNLELKPLDYWNDKGRDCHPDLIEISIPEDLLNLSELIDHNDIRHMNHDLFNTITRPNIPLHFDLNYPIINDIEYKQPLFLPLQNILEELKQVAILELGKPISIIGSTTTITYAQFGKHTKDAPVFISFELDTTFKLINLGYRVIMVIFRETFNGQLKLNLSHVQVKQIAEVCTALSKAYYSQIYILTTPTHPQIHQSLLEATYGLYVRFIETEIHIAHYDDSDMYDLKFTIEERL